MDHSKPSFIRRPTPEEIEHARNDLQDKAFALFKLLLAILRIPECNRKLPCLRPESYLSEDNGNSNRFQAAFLVCWRLMERTERRFAKTEMLWHLYREEESLSSLHKQLLQDEIDPDEFPPFLEWCAARGNNALTPFQVFRSLVKSSQDMSREAFLDLWHNLSDHTQDSLKAFWLRIITCGCHRITPKEMSGEFVYWIQLTKSHPALPLQ